MCTWVWVWVWAWHGYLDHVPKWCSEGIVSEEDFEDLLDGDVLGLAYNRAAVMRGVVAGFLPPVPTRVQLPHEVPGELFGFTDRPVQQ